jgi:hypothetical protein
MKRLSMEEQTIITEDNLLPYVLKNPKTAKRCIYQYLNRECNTYSESANNLADTIMKTILSPVGYVVFTKKEIVEIINSNLKIIDFLSYKKAK